MDDEQYKIARIRAQGIAVKLASSDPLERAGAQVQINAGMDRWKSEFSDILDAARRELAAAEPAAQPAEARRPGLAASVPPNIEKPSPVPPVIVEAAASTMTDRRLLQERLDAARAEIAELRAEIAAAKAVEPPKTDADLLIELQSLASQLSLSALADGIDILSTAIAAKS